MDDPQEQKIESVDDVIDNMTGPETREQLISDASDAPDSVRAQIERLPEGEYYKAEDVQNSLKSGVGPQDESSDS